MGAPTTESPSSCPLGCNTCGYNWYERQYKRFGAAGYWKSQNCACCMGNSGEKSETSAKFQTCKKACTEAPSPTPAPTPSPTPTPTPQADDDFAVRELQRTAPTWASMHSAVATANGGIKQT